MIENNEQNKNLNPTVEGSNTASGSKQKGKERASGGGSNISEKEMEKAFSCFEVKEKDEKDLEIIRMQGDIWRLKEEWEKKVDKFGKTRYSSEEECLKEEEIINKLETEARTLIKKLKKLESEKLASKLSAKDYQGKEVIKAEISQELIEAKEIFANFQISKTTQEEIKNKINKHVDRIENTWNGGNTTATVLSIIPIVGNVVGPIHAADHSATLEKNFKKQTKEILPGVVNKLIDNATADLEKQKKKVLKKMDALIESRSKEVADAKKVIEALEIVNQEIQRRYGALKIETDQEIQNLQGEIGKLINQLKKYREKEADAQKFLNKQRAEKAKKIMDNINYPIQDNQAKIKALEDYINTLETSLKFAEDGRDQREKELNDLKDTFEKTKSLWNTKLTNKENELKSERQIFLDQQKKLNDEIREWEKKYNQAKDEKHELDLENVDLKAENKKLKDKYNKAKNEAEEWKTKWEGLQPTWIQKKLSDLGITQFKNTIATSASIAGVFVILYAISWMWKNVIKETWKNFKGEPEEEPRPRRKERIKYDDYEEISEPKEKTQSLPEKQPTIIINNSTPAEKEGKSPAVVNKEAVKQEEILTQISSDTIPKEKKPQETEKAESEQGNKNSKKNGSRKKKKNKKKVKGDSS